MTPDLNSIINDNIQRVFKGKLDLGKLENLDTNELFKTAAPEEYYSFISAEPNVQRKSKFQANILRTLAAHFQPTMVKAPHNDKFFENSFRWFNNTLKFAPIIFFLRQEHRLFSSSMINQLNKPLFDLSHLITQLSQSFINEQNYNSNDDKLRRNYHLTNLSDFGVFSAAVKAHTEDFQALDWQQINSTEDKLCDRLQMAQKLQVMNNSNEPVVGDTKIVENYPISNIMKQLSDNSADVKDIFPYDLQFSTFNLITIEDRIIKQSHQTLLDTLHRFHNDFEIVGVRLSTEDEHIYNFFQHGLDQPTKKDQTYESMLKSIERTHYKDVHEENIHTVIKTLGQWGLTNVEEGQKNCIYLFPN